jgi:hypothetical protein
MLVYVRPSNEALRGRAFREHRTNVGALSSPAFRDRSFSLQGWGLIDLPLRASNEGLLRPRVARAQKIISLHPLPLLSPHRPLVHTDAHGYAARISL